MNKTFILCVAVLFAVSCSSTVSGHMIGDVLSADGAKLVYVSKFDYKDEDLYDSFIKYRSKNENCFYCDVGIADNLPLLYAFQFNQLPALIKISEDNHCSDVMFGKSVPEHWLESAISLNDDTDKIMLVTLHWAIDSNDVNHVSSILTTITPSDFYSYYLFYRGYELLGNDALAKEYRDKAIIVYEENPLLSYSILFKELVSGDEECPIVALETRNLEFGEILEPGRYTKSISYKNYSNQPAIIVNAIPSCSCLDVEFDNIVEANEIGHIRISFIADEKPKRQEFRKTIYLVTNFQTSDICLTVEGVY